MKFFDLQQPFFLPIWRRVATFGVATAWAVFELVSGSPGWAALFGALALYCGYQFFFVFNLETHEELTDD